MDIFVKAIETTGTINEQRHLVIDEPLPIACQVKVRVIILVPKTTELSEKEWYYPVTNKSTYDFVNETKEDIYTPTEEKPVSPHAK